MKAILLFESLRPSSEEQRSFRIENPDEVYSCGDPDEIESLLRKVEARVHDGCFAAGFLAYEGGFAFLPAMPRVAAAGLPLAWFAVTRNIEHLHEPKRVEKQDRPEIRDLHLNKTLAEYRNAIDRIKQRIERGDTYQVNYTLRYRGLYGGSPLLLYETLKMRQRVNYAALIQTEDWAVISLSPELFFRKSGRNVTMRPMKGTIARGRDLAEDALQARHLRESAKETSENLMIVDLLRNDLGKICEPGSIRVSQPMQVERYETLLQMTTTIEGQLREDSGTTDLIRATFPSGSITGAPKVRTMQIIHELETDPRGIYTGAVGYLSGEESVFNVAIRTVFLDRRHQTLEMGAGSGILYEADPEREYRECELKARFLTDPSKPFQLFETILWTPGSGFALLEFHLDRMLASAEYFLFPTDRARLRKTLEDKSLEWKHAGETLRVRVTMDDTAAISIYSEPLRPAPALPRVRLAKHPVNSEDAFLFHKTTRRELYDLELEKAQSEGFFDVIFQNERGEITEGAISNVVTRKGAEYFTPPIDCGLLAGTFRRHLLETQSVTLREQVLVPRDLQQADDVFLTNALRGLLRVTL